MSNRRTSLQIVEDRRNELSLALTNNNVVVQTLAPQQQEDFKKNFLEFASQDYLLSVIEPKEIIRFAVNVTKVGLSIAPSANEVYIIPFDTKVNGTKVMLPQAIIPLNGMQQLAYQAGFMLTVDPVYKFSETECEAARNLSRLQQSKLDTANPEWLNKHFIGYDVILKDLQGNLGEQVYFVDSSYVKAATKTNKDARWSLSTWTHKAVRKAYKQFLVPRERAIEKFEKLEHLNDEAISDIEVVSSSVLTSKIEKAVKQLGLKIDKSSGSAVVVGSTYGKAELLKSFGFVENNNVWSMECSNTPSNQTDVQQQQTKLSPAHELKNYLIQKGIQKARLGEFVKDVLATSSADIEGMQAALADKNALDAMITTFLAEPSAEEVNMDDVF